MRNLGNYNRAIFRGERLKMPKLKTATAFAGKMKQFALKTNAAENLFGVYLMIITCASLAPYISQIPGFRSSDVFSFCFVNYKRYSRIYVSALYGPAFPCTRAALLPHFSEKGRCNCVYILAIMSPGPFSSLL